MRIIPTTIALCLAGLMTVSASAAALNGGDLDGDGRLTVTDISKLAAYVKGIRPLRADELAFADVNGDGSVNATDISVLAAHVKGIEIRKAVEPYFIRFDDYLTWAKEVGYSSGSLLARGVNGINQDIYRTLPEQAGYESGKIVIGDSRSCQLGIYEQHCGRNDTAVFAVWGSHYADSSPKALDSETLADIRECFGSQIRRCGRSTIYLFATVNDYYYNGYSNSGNIAAAVSAAKTLKGLTCEYGGVTYSPQVVIVGIEGCDPNRKLFGSIDPTYFNGYIADYNSRLKAAAEEEGFGCFITVDEMAGGSVGFIDDGLHYDEKTLDKIGSYIASANASCY